GHKRIYIEEAFHGKSESISSTSLLVRTGAPGPKVTASIPETGSITIFAFLNRFFLGVKTIRSPSTLASRGSPARRPSRWRIGLGRTTWPLVEMRVCMVRRSYHNSHL